LPRVFSSQHLWATILGVCLKADGLEALHSGGNVIQLFKKAKRAKRLVPMSWLTIVLVAAFLLYLFSRGGC
jgi:hypothetical protein